MKPIHEKETLCQRLPEKISRHGNGRHNADGHSTIGEDIRSLCGTQGSVAKAPLNLIYVADFSKLGDREDDKKLLYAAADTGFISQNVYLFCAAHGLGTVVRDWIDRQVLAEKVNLRKEQRIILAQTVGYPK